METLADISIETGETGTEAIRGTFQDFLERYQSILSSAEGYLCDIVDTKAPQYGEAYRPWQDALHTLLRGAYLISKKNPLPDTELFLESLYIFSMGSGAQFLRDVCLCGGTQLPRDWIDKFREYINWLLFAFAMLSHPKQEAAC